ALSIVAVLADATQSWTIRAMAAQVLSKLGKKASPGVPALIEAIWDEDPLHFVAVTTLGELGPVAEAASDTLLQVFLDPCRKPMQRFSAAKSLGAVLRNSETKAKALVPALLERFTAHDEDRSVREGSVAALGSLGPAAANAVPHLEAGLADPVLGTSCAVALIKIGLEPSASTAMAQLASSLASTEKHPRWVAIQPLIGFSADDIRHSSQCMMLFEHALPQLIALADECTEDSTMAVELLAQMGPAAQSAIPTIRSLLHRGPRELRDSAAKALTQIDAD
ncbi:MAG TPA: hypothetical protein VFD71_19520, partial [Planctomycetota bacterium]|nr:hypothetical protein [Planctomycetota bacterium]